MLYWGEANTNVIRTADVFGVGLKTVVRRSADVVWPRALLLLPAHTRTATGKRVLVWTHFLGVISRAATDGSEMFTLVDSLVNSDLKVVEAKVAAMNEAFRFGALGKIFE
jgi:hypothetical protein